ncbi:MAG: hypothetical protein PVJ57_19210 [Phycisphaerae bacterium]|jgi:hypothetical protein
MRSAVICALSIGSLFLISCGGSLFDQIGGTDAPGGTDTAVSISGRLAPGDAAKIRPRAQGTEPACLILAQSNETGTVYRAATDGDGQFEIDIPDSEAGNTFAVSILGPDGKPLGPVIFQSADGEGAIGVAADRDVSLGTIDLPDDPTVSPIVPGDDSDAGDLVDGDLSTRLNDQGVPVGLASYGKGTDADVDEDDTRQVDGDHDGLIDVLDADDDGDGIVDDFEADSDSELALPDVRAGFFMNLKIYANQAPTYYNGTAAEISAALATDTIITLECATEPTATRTITAVRLLEVPGPTYLPDADLVSDTGGGLAYTNWASLSYAFEEASDRFEAFMRPNAEMDAGDTFTVEITFDDSTTEQYSRMINYVFKNIPRLVSYGSATIRHTFDVTDTTVNGTDQQPIPFDGTHDLVLTFEPPVDENGDFLTDVEHYTFQIFYTAADRSQLNDSIDWSATWTTPITGFDRGNFDILTAEMTFDPVYNTYTVTLGSDAFADTVETGTGTQAVAQYKIDITAEAPTGNAAIMLSFVKQ